jgi:EAL domain-containing protein (putative c-di-GMP-specific phosphodiesterase class I)/GGDEF domain-containing protein
MTIDLPDDSPLRLGACGYPRGFIDALQNMTHNAAQGSYHCGLIVVAIDNMPMMMSGYSVAVAEAVMNELHEVIDTHAGAASMVTRTQRDQFGVLVPKTTERDLAAMCLNIQNAIRQYSYHSRYGDLHCMASTASSVLPDGEAASEEILGRTLVALSEGGSTPISNEERSAKSREQMGLANFLGTAIAANRIKLAYQPVIESKTGAVSHYEALLRLYSEDGKISSAGTLIPVAERMGLIGVIDSLTLDMVVKELRHDKDVVLALNISNLTTQDIGWLKKLTDYINETPDIAKRMIIELTETAIHRDLKHTAMFTAELQSLGCMVALDDFGSGYTSFRQLKALEVDMIKIDGMFIKDLTDNADSRFFVKTLLDFTQGFGLKSVAEFVENGEVAKMLMELGVDHLQGYYFGKPMNSRKWLKEG